MTKDYTPEELLEIAIQLLREGGYKSALNRLNEAIKKGGYDHIEEIPPRILSYLGLALALAEKKIRNGALFCETAIKREFYNPLFYLNLGKVYCAGGYKLRALDAFQNGLRIDGENPEIQAELKKMGIRHRPILPFLPRTHVVNKYLGLMLSFIR
jgi:tetratricopeptide (TPR) repeat protein